MGINDEENGVKVWIDADACPKLVKDIVFRAAMKRQVHLILVANQVIQHPKSAFIHMIKVGAGFDVADNYIVQECRPNDLIVTADIPLADLVVKKGAFAIEPRGRLLTPDNIAERISTRNLMESLRSIGEVRGGPSSFSASDSQSFANGFDRLLTQLMAKKR